MRTEPSRPTGPVLLMLAGPRGSGKSSLTRHALSQRIALFGDEYADQFFGFSREFRAREDSVEDIAAGTSWIGLPQLAKMDQLRRPPAAMFLHIDLMTLFLVHRRPYQDLSDLRSYPAFIDEFLAFGFLRWFERIVVRTVVVPLPVAARQHAARLSQKGWGSHPNIARLYQSASGQEATYECFYRAWAQLLDQLRLQLGQDRRQLLELDPIRGPSGLAGGTPVAAPADACAGVGP